MVDHHNDDVEAHLERLRKDKTVALEQVTLLHEWLDRKRSARQCGRITGESRTGKTKACEAYVKRRGATNFSSKVPIISVAHIMLGDDCTSRELYKGILEHYNFDLPKGTIGDARSLSLKVLRESKTEVLIIDEADRLKPRTFAHVRDIFDQLRIAVILVGTKQRLDLAVKADEQVYNRFRASYQIGTIPSNQLERIVAVWERDIIALPVISNLTNEPVLKIIRKATGAPRRGYYIGLIDMILRDSAIRSLEKGLMYIDTTILEEVAQECC